MMSPYGVFKKYVVRILFSCTLFAAVSSELNHSFLHDRSAGKVLQWLETSHGGGIFTPWMCIEVLYLGKEGLQTLSTDVWKAPAVYVEGGREGEMTQSEEDGDAINSHAHSSNVHPVPANVDSAHASVYTAVHD